MYMIRNVADRNIEVMMKENNKANQIAKHIIENPSQTQSEIAQHFGVSRQRIEQVYKKCLTDVQKAAREEAKEREVLNSVLPLVKDCTPKSIISAVTGHSLNKIDAIFNHPEIQKILIEKENKKNNEIETLSADWLSGMTLSEIKKKYGWEWSLECSSGYISRLRTKYPEKFPLRLHNQTPLQEQNDKYELMKSQGMSNEAISAALGYKNVASMKSALYQLNKSNEPTTA